MSKNSKQSDELKPKKAPLVYINRLERKELDARAYEGLPRRNK